VGAEFSAPTFYLKMKTHFIFILIIISFNSINAQIFRSNLVLDGRYSLYNDTFNYVLSDYKNGNAQYTYIDSADIPLDITETTIADSSGNLVFATNGSRICNRQYKVIPNGDSLDTSNCGLWAIAVTGQNLPQGAFFIPSRTNPNQIILIHQDCDYKQMFGIFTMSSHNLWFTVLDTTLNTGLGGVISRNNVLFNGEFTGGSLQAVKHANGKDYWIIAQDIDTAQFMIWLYSDTGFAGPYFQVMNIPIYFTSEGCSVFNREGNKYVSGTWNKRMALFDFDRCTGLFHFTNKVDTAFIYNGFAFAFSPDGSKIYRNGWTQNGSDVILQYDTADTDFNLSRDTVAIYDGFVDSLVPGYTPTHFGGIYLADDDKVYINATSTHYKHEIKFPNLSGVNCTVVQHAIKHKVYISRTIPHAINYSLGPLPGCDTLSAQAPKPPEGDLIQCFPNPTNNDITMKLNNIKQGAYTLRIYSPLTQVVYYEQGKNAGNIFAKTINVSALAQGIYFVKVVCGGEVYGGRFVRE
jgi:hypothetical protein